MWGGRLCGFLVLCWSIAQCYGQEQRRKRRIGIGVITECFEKTTYPFGLNTAFRDFNHTKYNGTAFEFVVANLRHNSCKDEEGNDPLEAAGVLLAMFSKGVSAVIGLVGSAV
uniref:Receptor ligand binding region domain-containing protein n=1 Tax=Chromera velia CCMP2878 TaxID=1169474 RepID=A0A0G4FR42_9ALVE|eukprot:Cvel_18312.t1-p1 / transcript=Cvel_18312.t1 / gene=Cvel_18312 / organism=Chromera_velia_CCMP2878 / gene_product=hypothetical protein / transcript_product=hypothetical protein / location=Cvel_scaffold1511:1455-2515(+) / protein_length=111 / sequence_SO=supercontig / SO=protein_coding / is_pseudo=false